MRSSRAALMASSSTSPSSLTSNESRSRNLYASAGSASTPLAAALTSDGGSCSLALSSAAFSVGGLLLRRGVLGFLAVELGLQRVDAGSSSGPASSPCLRPSWRECLLAGVTEGLPVDFLSSGLGRCGRRCRRCVGRRLAGSLGRGSRWSFPTWISPCGGWTPDALRVRKSE